MLRACLLLACLLLTSARAGGTLYVLGWSSALPVQIRKVEVTGGALVQVLLDGSGQSGTIAAAADRACLTIEAWGATTTGIGVHFAQSWDAGCARLYFPIARRE